MESPSFGGEWSRIRRVAVDEMNIIKIEFEASGMALGPDWRLLAAIILQEELETEQKSNARMKIPGFCRMISDSYVTVKA